MSEIHRDLDVLVHESQVFKKQYFVLIAKGLTFKNIGGSVAIVLGITVTTC